MESKTWQILHLPRTRIYSTTIRLDKRGRGRFHPIDFPTPRNAEYLRRRRDPLRPPPSPGRDGFSGYSGYTPPR